MPKPKHAAAQPVEWYDEYQDSYYMPAPCQEGCPVGTDIPSYIGLVWEGNHEAAYEVIHANNPFSSVCGRVCAKPCEDSCRRADSDAAAAIRGIKRFVTDQFGPEYALAPVSVTQSKTVGIVGSGPAGLTAAQDLAEAGYEVHIYEKLDRLGGMMTAGIPPFRLPQDLLKADIERILKHCPGIVVHLNTALGEHVTLEELKERHDAVLLAIGLWVDRMLGVPGEEEGLKGLHGIRFLTDINEGKDVRLSGKAVVVGGGNVAIDVARTAMRAGAESVELLCLETREEMPAWKHEIAEAEAEGIVIHNSWGPKQILHRNGAVAGVEFMRCVSVFDEEGRFNPKYDAQTTRTVEADALLLAIGLAAENPGFDPASGMMTRAYVKANFEDMRTADPKVFAAGDGAFGPSAIVYAMQHGHRAAYYIQAFLQGDENPAPYQVPYRTCQVPLAQEPEWEKLPREEQILRALGEKPSLHEEVDLTYDLETARLQAARCLRCDVETGTAEYSRRTREHMHAMSKAEPGDTERQRQLLRLRLRPRDNPFPPERPPQLDDVVFLAAALTRLVIDPYREKCVTKTRIGRALELEQPYLFTGFDDAPLEVRQGLSRALAATGCGYIGRRALAGTNGVPWLQLVVDGENEPETAANGLIHVVGRQFRPVSPERLHGDQLLGLAVAAPALAEAIPYALENEFDLLLLDGTRGVDIPWAEVDGAGDLTVIRDAIRILRELNREEDLALLYYGALRTGTDVAKVLAMNCSAGVFSVAMGLALGGTIRADQLSFEESQSFDGSHVAEDSRSAEERSSIVEELAAAGENWIRGTVQETAIIGRCTGKTNVHNLEPEDMRAITLATSEALGIPLASGGGAREYF